MRPLPPDVVQKLVEHLQPGGPTADEVMGWPPDLQRLVLIESRVPDGGHRRADIPPEELAERTAEVRAEREQQEIAESRRQQEAHERRCRKRYQEHNRASMRRWREAS